jgi:DNA invertase Pin-like site-specific DNA recombinase
MQGQRIGYVRVSTVDQNPARQLEQVQVDRFCRIFSCMADVR